MKIFIIIIMVCAMFIARGNEQMGEWEAAGLKCGKNDKYNFWMKSFWKKNSLLFLFTRVDFIKMNLIKDPLTRKKSCEDLMKIFIEYDKVLKNSGQGGLCLTVVEKQPDIYAYFLIDEAWNNSLRAYMSAIFEGLRFPKLEIASRPRFNIHADDQGKCMFYKKISLSEFFEVHQLLSSIDNSKIADSHHALLLALCFTIWLEKKTRSHQGFDGWENEYFRYVKENGNEWRKSFEKYYDYDSFTFPLSYGKEDGSNSSGKKESYKEYISRQKYHLLIFDFFEFCNGNRRDYRE